MKKLATFVLIVSLVFIYSLSPKKILATSYKAGTNIFADTFTRADNNAVGNGWSELEVGADNISIVSNTLTMFGTGNNLAVAYRAGSNFTNAIYTWQFSNNAPGPSGEDSFCVRHDSSTRNTQGLCVLFNSIALTVTDGGTQKGTGPLVTTLGTFYNVEWVITANNYMELRGWAVGTVRPTNPTVIINGFTPVTTDTNWAFLGRTNGKVKNFSVDTLLTSNSSNILIKNSSVTMNKSSVVMP